MPFYSYGRQKALQMESTDVPGLFSLDVRASKFSDTDKSRRPEQKTVPGNSVFLSVCGDEIAHACINIQPPGNSAVVYFRHHRMQNNRAGWIFFFSSKEERGEVLKIFLTFSIYGNLCNANTKMFVSWHYASVNNGKHSRRITLSYERNLCNKLITLAMYTTAVKAGSGIFLSFA